MINGTTVTKINTILNEAKKKKNCISPEELYDNLRYNDTLTYLFNKSIILSSTRTKIKEVVQYLKNNKPASGAFFISQL